MWARCLSIQIWITYRLVVTTIIRLSGQVSLFDWDGRQMVPVKNPSAVRTWWLCACRLPVRKEDHRAGIIHVVQRQVRVHRISHDKRTAKTIDVLRRQMRVVPEGTCLVVERDRVDVVERSVGCRRDRAFCWIEEGSMPDSLEHNSFNAYD
jgi:hypothetical protein